MYRDIGATNVLPQKGVLFLGGHQNMTKKLRQQFPKWTFVSDDQLKRCGSIKHTLVFYWTGHGSHKLMRYVYSKLPENASKQPLSNIDVRYAGGAPLMYGVPYRSEASKSPHPFFFIKVKGKWCCKKTNAFDCLFTTPPKSGDFLSVLTEYSLLFLPYGNYKSRRVTRERMKYEKKFTEK